MIELFPSREIFLSIGSFSIHWYGIMYLIAFLVAWYLLPRLQKYRSLDLTADQWSQLLSWGIIGVLAGGRLGYVLLYAPQYFLQHPLEILMVWKGGMASHGGFIGVILALLLFCKKHRISPFVLGDIIVIPVAIGLALGRVGNFINQELYGVVTTVPWAMHFDGADGLRHPTQIYAIIKDLTITICCYLALRSTYWKKGTVGALFLILYGCLRFTVEIFRDQPHGYLDVLGIQLSLGQVYSVPIVALGFVVFILTRKGANN